MIEPFCFCNRTIYNHFHIKYKSSSNLLEIAFNSNTKERAPIGTATTSQIQFIMMICIWFVFDYGNSIKNLMGSISKLKVVRPRFSMIIFKINALIWVSVNPANFLPYFGSQIQIKYKSSQCIVFDL